MVWVRPAQPPPPARPKSGTAGLGNAARSEPIAHLSHTRRHASGPEIDHHAERFEGTSTDPALDGTPGGPPCLARARPAAGGDDRRQVEHVDRCRPVATVRHVVDQRLVEVAQIDRFGGTRASWRTSAPRSSAGGFSPLGRAVRRRTAGDLGSRSRVTRRGLTRLDGLRRSVVREIVAARSRTPDGGGGGDVGPQRWDSKFAG